MDDKIFPQLLILIIVPILSLYMFKPGLTYDGGLYASLGYSLYKNHAYEFNGAPGDVPPFFPLLLAVSFFFFGEKGMYIVSPIMSIVLVLSAYFLLKKSSGIAFLGALLLFSTKMVFTYSVFVLREITMFAFVLLSYLLYEKKRKFLGISIAFAFLTKYTALIYLLPILLISAYKKEKWVLSSILFAMIIIAPWAAWSFAVHGTPFKEHQEEYVIKLDWDSFYSTALLNFKTWFFAPVLILSALGILKSIYRRELDKYLLLLIFVFLAVLLWHIKGDRYLLVGAFPVVYFSLYFLSPSTESGAGTKIAAIFLVIAIAVQMYSSIAHVNMAGEKYLLLEDAGRWLRSNAPNDAAIMTQSFRQIAFFAQRRTFPVPLEDWYIEPYISMNNITHIAVDNYEAMTPKYIYEYVKNKKYPELASFEKNGKFVRIYKITSSSLR